MSKKISELDSPTLPLTGTELMEMSQDSTSVQVTIIQLGNSIGYVDRGDPSGDDLNKAGMTLDSAWNIWDVSAVVPAGATAVELEITQVNTNVGKRLEFRKNGNSKEKNILAHKQIVSSVTEVWGGKVSCDSNRIIEYFATGTAVPWISIAIVIRGWYI
ncbi:MAG: hypothetical protein GOV02_03120 [Candidatus Aenigmarchaeota archaeon]|nr:hypothetical protein [Candidatus Aenigmarchaeota archaeon]